MIGKIALNRGTKQRVASIVEWPLVRKLMELAIKVVVGKHRVGVGVVVFNERGQVLMLEHVFHPGAPWGLPGGWLDRGEEPAACALRELREETGLSASLGPVLEIKRSEISQTIEIFYVATAQTGTITLSSEIIAARWCHPSTLAAPHKASVGRLIQRAAALQSSVTH